MADATATSGSADATTTTAQDSFPAQRDMESNAFSKTTTAGGTAADTANGDGGDAVRTDSDGLSPPASPPADRRLSREWDASKVPPSQFQRRKGSIYSTPSSRDSQHNNSDRDKAYHEKLKEKGWSLFSKK